MPDIQNLSPKAVKPLTLLNKTNEVIDALNENLNSSYAEQNPVLTSVEGICTWTVTHNLGTEDVSCTVYEGDKEIITDKEITSENVVTISINSSSNIPAETYSTLILVKGGIGSGGEGGGSGDITVDSSLSTSSTNPVQNRIITNALNGKIKGLKAPSTEYFSLVGGITPDANNIVSFDSGKNTTKYIKIDMGRVNYQTISLKYNIKWTSNFSYDEKAFLFSCTDATSDWPVQYLPHINGYYGFDFFYPNKYTLSTVPGSGFWFSVEVNLNKSTGECLFEIKNVSDGTVYYSGNPGYSNTSTNAPYDVYWAIGRTADTYLGDYQPGSQVDLASIVLTLDGVEHRMIDVDPYIEVDSLLVPEDIVDTGVAQLKQANADDLGLVRVDEEFNEESDNVLPNYLIAPFGSRFIPPYTTYHIEADGSGDFETLRDAVEFLGDGKWSSGTVNIELGEGNFDLFGTLNWGSSTTNIPNIHIFGQGMNATTINVQPPEDDPSAEYDAFTIWGGTVYFENLTIFNDSENTTYRGVVCEFGNLDGFGCDLIMQQVKVDGFGCNLWVSSLCRARLLECNIENYHERGIVAEGGDIKIEGTLTLRNVVKAEEEPAIDVYFGGRVTLYYPTIYTENITNLFGMDQEDFGKWRDNNGFIGGEYTQEDL